MVIALNSATKAEELSDFLWQFKPESFLPHQRQTEAGTAPITLVWDEDKDQYHEVLINLSAQVPPWFSRFQRVSEIVIQEAECLDNSREHYQFYRDRGYPLKSHQITAF